ncbi:hypothetical protein [Macrococcus epidermidis]|uniref:hypothetical protein n=1 Tax=Macrococcus epidermidis TaxID=1902580 RepID=UPI0020B8A8BD|nr:hypothetical protein [Macrococcus epidermidis]UTH16178.1 hypothetical protein KFV12_13150 [Macrococcus epidermidis]
MTNMTFLVPRILKILPFRAKKPKKDRGELPLLQMQTFICQKDELPIYFDNRVNQFMSQPWCNVQDVKVNFYNDNGHTMHVVTVLFKEETQEQY